MSADPELEHSSDEQTLVATESGGLGGRRPRADELADLPRGTIIGRYVILSKLGAGGMGVVFAAYDPELDRKVAIKLLVVGLDGSTGATTGRHRLLREAQALAKLSHPNVVAIHDVGMVDERVWLAMEFVEGKTLGQWLSSGPRHWREIVEILLDAGEGLAAAHAKGLLHRDFKPENVMVGNDGRVRVMDFGLARARDESAGASSASLMMESAIREHGSSKLRGGESGSLLGSHATQAGGLLGTPAYLAPEMFRGDRGTAAADQFAYCITLWEALYGERPFEGDNLVELAAHVLDGTMRSPPRGRVVPGWLKRICLRGLNVDPERRWPDMPALLAALARDPSRTRLRWGLLAGAAGVAATAFISRGVQREAQQRACLEAAGAVDQRWSPEAHTRLESQLGASGSIYARDTATRVVEALDEYARLWRDAKRSVCADAPGDNGPFSSPELAAARDACFDERLDAMSTLTEVLEAADGDALLRHAVVAAVELPRPSECLDPLRLRARMRSADGASESEARDELPKIHRASLAAGVRLQAGDLVGAEREARDALSRAEALDLLALEAEARWRLGSIERAAGRFPEAEADLRRAHFDATRAARDDVASNAAINLAHLHAVGRVDFELSETWLTTARALADRLARSRGVDLDPLSRIELAGAAAALATERADYDEAEARLQEVIAILEETYGNTHPDIGLMYGHLAELYDDKGDFVAAETAAKRGLELLEASLGPAHPDNSQAIFAWATAAWKTGRGEESLRLSERALEIRKAAFGPEHVSVAEALNSVGNAHIQLGDWEASHAAHSRALEIRKAVYGPDEPRVATSLVNLADVAAHAGRWDDAVAYAADSLRIWEDKLGREHAYCAYAHIVIGEGHLGAGRWSAALDAFDRALEIRRAGDESEQQLAEPLTGRGRALLELGRVDEALEPLERAWAIRTRHPTRELHAPDTAFVLARALWAAGEHTRARTLALEAQAQFAEVAAARPEGVAAVRSWLEATAAEG